MARLGAIVSLLALVLATSFLAVSAGGLTANYYAKTCPSVDKVVRETVYHLYEKKGNIATSLIRFGFHDWFNGADASFLLKSLPGKTSEKDSTTQEGMRNEKYVDNIKAAVDAACGPNVVSCADILAVGAAAGVQVLGGPYIPILFGRRDSRVSLKSSADKIPPPQGDVTSFLKFFAERGINTEQAVALMGAHTIGRAHCVSFKERIYPKVDPQMDPKFADMLKHRCPPNPTEVHFTYFRNDEQSPMAFDNHYYVNLVAKQGLMGIDSKLYWDKRTQPFVVKYAKDANYWRKVFATAYKQMSEYQPLTGKQGEIRKRCSYVN
ncbi:hypothetical protein M758_11G098000 [Ceratodon purpureus]|nr:hypothetical protein M758_11G098000 [Ceratodon purpureus]